MEHTHGETNMRSADGRVESQMHVRSGTSGTDGRTRSDLGGGRFAGLRDRAADFAERAREGMGDTLARAGGLGSSGDVLRTVRDNPLTSLTVAFSTGFLIAAARGGKKRHWVLDRARLQLRTIIVSAVTATLAHEIRSLIEDHDERDAEFAQGDDYGAGVDEEDDFSEDDIP